MDRGFRSVREAVADDENIRTAFSTWSNRLFVTYTEPIPAIEVNAPLFPFADGPTTSNIAQQSPCLCSQIEIVLAGERGPRRLDQ